MQMTKYSRRVLWLILAVALIIRLIVLFATGWTSLPQIGGDGLWYLINGQGLFMSEPRGTLLGHTYAADDIKVAPLYMFFNGLIQITFGYIPALGIIRLLQIIMTVIVCYFAFDIGRLVSNDFRVGMVASLAMALSITWIVEPLNIMTETLYITLMTSAIWAYCRWIIPQIAKPNWIFAILVGLLLGLATLTRAAGLLFPIGIAGHIVVISGRQNWKRSLKTAFIILISYSLIISTWTVYSLVRYDRFITVGNQFFPTLWRGASDEDGSPDLNDELLGDQTAQEQSAEIITSDPAGYLILRAHELAGAYLQPHGTLAFAGESLKALALRWFNDNFSLDGFQRMVTGDAFVPKLLIYIWHYVALIGGIIGIWLSRQQWRVSLVLIGFIVYTTLIHTVLLAIPRYIFPTYVFYIVFASVTLVAMWDWLHGMNKKEAE